MKKRLLTLSDLCDYYVQNFSNSVHFSAKEEHSQIIVQVAGSMKFDDNSDIEGLLPVYLQSCHIGKNRNGSGIKEENMNKAMNSIKNRPIMGYIHEVDGKMEFYGHNMHLDENDNFVYDEIAVGIIPESCNAELKYDEEKDKTYLCVNGYLFEEYTEAANILRREKECFVSVELCIRELSYDAKEKYLDLEDFYFSAVTILGKDEDGEIVEPGMDGSNVTLADFSAKNNSILSHNDLNEKLIDTLEKLNTTLSSFNINNNLKEGGKTMNKLQELMEKYSKTEADIEFETEGLSDEELEAKFSELFEDDTDTSSEENTDGSGEDTGETEPADPGNPSGGETDSEPEPKPDETVPQEDENEEKKKKLSIEIGDKKYSFDISLNDKIYALQELVNSTYSEADNAYYSIQAYDKYVIMVDWWDGKAFKQSYKEEDSNFTLTGDRVEVFSNWLTAEEEDALNEMRSNYSIIKEKLNTYEKAELDAQKDAIFADESYSTYLQEEEFKSLMEEKDNYSVDELKDKAELAFAKCVKKNGNFSAKPETPKSTRKQFNTTKKTKAKRPYGNIFANKQN